MDLTGAQRQTATVESVLYGVLTDEDGKGALADGLSVGGLPAVVRAKPAAAGVTEVLV